MHYVMEFPDNLYALSDHILYVIENNDDVQRKFFSFNDFAKTSISNHISKLTRRGWIKNVNGTLLLDAKGKERYAQLMSRALSTKKLSVKIVELLDKGDNTIADIARLLYPDAGEKTRESTVRAAILSLMRKNKVQAGHMHQRHRLYTTNFKLAPKMDPVKIDNMALLQELVAITVNRKKVYE